MKIIITISILMGIMLFTFSALMDSALADVTNSGATTLDQDCTSSGGCTSISGGYNQDTVNNNDGQQNTTNNTTNTTSNSYTGDTRTAASVGNSGSIPNQNQDVCSISISGGVSKAVIGFSVSGHYTDPNCVMLKQVRLLNNLGLKTAAVARMCLHSEEIFRALLMSGSYCPYEGRVGVQAEEAWKKYWELRPDKETYILTEKYIKKIDEELNNEDNKSKYILDSNGNPTNIIK